MLRMLNAGEIVGRHARLIPDRIGARDLSRSLTYQQWNERACRLANALLGLGLSRGDRFGVLAYNCLEWMEIYVAAAKAGLVAVPINFRFVASEILYIVENCKAKALITQTDLLDRIEEVRASGTILEKSCLVFGSGNCPAGFQSYEELISRSSPNDPEVNVSPEDTWTLLYTSGTTGKPKGVMRTHEQDSLLHLVVSLELGFGKSDTSLLVMPMCHANSLWFSFVSALGGGTAFVYNLKNFDPEHLLRTLAEQNITFTSLVPTHYIMMLGLPDAVKRKYNVDKTDKLLISSAPARRDTKLAIMEHFKNSNLFEMYGSTEGGFVTVLPPEEQLQKLGSIGREFTATGKVKLLDPDGNEVREGDVGELYFQTPFTFKGYWKMPDKTAEAFCGAHCSVGDMARRDEDGYYFLVDRKSNMIISGGENVYPSEVEGALGRFPKVKDVAVIGVPHEKWGESVHAVIVLRDGEAGDESEVLEWCKDKLAGYKRPRSVTFISEDEMPRTATGKIQHRILRQLYQGKLGGRQLNSEQANPK